jgi:hypothetical protein
MHFLPDTVDEESIQERYWPDNFKKVIHEIYSKNLSEKLKVKYLQRIYLRRYAESFADILEFKQYLINAIAIGAENGADEGFESIYKSFLCEESLPCLLGLPKLLWPLSISANDKKMIHDSIYSDYFPDDGFIYAYNYGYKNKFKSYTDFINEVADLIIEATINGADNAIMKLYLAFSCGLPLPLIRRNPKRLKTW